MSAIETRGERRDEDGRLTSVVVEGTRLYSYVPDAIARLRSALEMAAALLEDHEDQTQYGEACVTHDKLRAALSTAGVL